MIWLYGLFLFLVVAKELGAEFIQNVSRWWIYVPLLITILWFEVFERLLGFDKKRDLQDASFEKAKKERIERNIRGPKKR